MLINFNVIGKFDDEIEDKKFSLDLDAREDVSNMKVHITLKYPNLETDSFNLYYNGLFLNPKSGKTLIQYKMKQNCTVELNNGSGCKCTLI